MWPFFLVSIASPAQELPSAPEASVADARDGFLPQQIVPSCWPFLVYVAARGKEAFSLWLSCKRPAVCLLAVDVNDFVLEAA